MKISTKISLAFLPGLFLVAGAIGLFVYPSLTQALKKPIGDNHILIGRQTMDAIDRALYERYKDIQAIAGDAVFPNYILDKSRKNERALLKRLEVWLELSGPWDEVMLVGVDGKIEFSSDKRFIGRRVDADKNERGAFTRALAGSVYYSDLVSSRHGEKPAIIFSAPLVDFEDPDRRILGAVVARMSWPVILEFLGTTQEPPQYQLYSAAGVLIGASDPQEKLGVLCRDENIQPILKFAREGKVGTVLARPLGGKEHLVAYVPQLGYLNYKGSGWSLIVKTPFEAAFLAGRRVLERFILILSILFGISFLASNAMIQALVARPLGAFAAVVGGVAEGDLSKKIELSSKDELGELARSFNLMVTHLNETTVSKDHMDSIIKSMIDSLLVVDREGRIKMVNRATLDILGYREEELIGKSIEVLLGEESGSLFRVSALGDILKNGSTAEYESFFRTKAGEKIFILISGSILKSNKGEAGGIVIIAKDLTQRKKTEDDLKLFLSLINQSNDAIYTIDPETSLFLYVNEKACRNSGRSREELLRMGVVDVDPRIPNVFAWKALVEEVKKRGAMIVDGEHRRKDGSIFPIEVNVKFTSVGQREYLVAIVRDVTERKKIESMLAQSEKLSAIGHLAAGVAHEINNPLGVILGFAQSAAKKIQASDALSLPIRSIEREALRCKSLVQDLLTFSRQNNNRNEKFSFCEMVAGTLSIIEAQARVKSVEVVREMRSESQFWGDRNQLQQVIINLCSNAMDSMPGGGKVTVRVSDALLEDRRHIVLEVQDTGGGIAKEIQDKIFNPFFTTKEVGKGTGLGLSLVYEIVRKHGGTITLASSPGQGTLFTVRLPVEAAEMKA